MRVLILSKFIVYECKTPKQERVVSLVHCHNNQDDPDQQVWLGYKLVADNVDKNIRPRYQTTERQTKSEHMVHVLGIRGRINLRHISDKAPPLPKYLSLNDFLLQQADLKDIMDNFATYVARYA